MCRARCLTHRHCHSYGAGHLTHYIAALRVHPDTPRVPVTVRLDHEQGWVLVTYPGGEQVRWWHHDADRLRGLSSLEEDRPALVASGTTFLPVPLTGSTTWIYCALRPTRCRPAHRNHRKRLVPCPRAS